MTKNQTRGLMFFCNNFKIRDSVDKCAEKTDQAVFYPAAYLRIFKI